MVASRNRPKGGLAPFGLGILTFLLTPSVIGYQELAAYIARQGAPVERGGQAHNIASPFGTIHAPAITLPRPISAVLPASDRKSTRLNSSHTVISYAVFCLKKKKRHKKVE